MSLDTPEPTGLSNDFATIADISVESIANRVAPRQVATGITRGAQVTSGADGFPQVLVGNQQTFGNGLYVAKPAIDVITNTDSDNFIFNSNQNVFKIIQTGTTTIPALSLATGAGNWGTSEVDIGISHGLDFAPILLAFAFNVSSHDEYALIPVQINGSPGITGAYWVSFTAFADTEQLFFEQSIVALNMIINAPAVAISYYVLQETAAVT